MTEQNNRRWLVPAILGVIAVAVVAVIAFVATRPAPLPDPYEAMNKALDGLTGLPNPATLGVLGQGKTAGEPFAVSGNLNLQADEDGMEVFLTDFTIGHEENSSELEVYINRDTMAVRDPEMGDAWYGVTLQEGLKAQAVQAVGEGLVDWYFANGALDGASSALDGLRGALVEVHDLTFSEMISDLRSDLAQLPAIIEKTESGFTVTFDVDGQPLPGMSDDLAAFAEVLFQDGHGLDGVTAIALRMDEEERLTALELTADSFFFLLEMGDPDEPTPRLEVQAGERNSVELAFTVAEGKGFTAPEYLNVFDLLNALAGRE